MFVCIVPTYLVHINKFSRDSYVLKIERKKLVKAFCLDNNLIVSIRRE